MEDKKNLHMEISYNTWVLTVKGVKGIMGIMGIIS